MKDKKFLFFLLLSIVVGSCRGDYGTTEEIAECYEKKGITFDKEVECCVVLPEVGCEGCIAAGVQLFLDNKKSFLKTQKKESNCFYNGQFPKDVAPYFRTLFFGRFQLSFRFEK